MSGTVTEWQRQKDQQNPRAMQQHWPMGYVRSTPLGSFEVEVE